MNSQEAIFSLVYLQAPRLEPTGECSEGAHKRAPGATVCVCGPSAASPEEAIFSLAYPRAPQLGEPEDWYEPEVETISLSDYLELCEGWRRRFATWLRLDPAQYSFESDRLP